MASLSGRSNQELGLSPRDADTVTVLAVAELEEEVLMHERRAAAGMRLRCPAQINIRLGKHKM
jgi:hypothetical protein